MFTAVILHFLQAPDALDAQAANTQSELPSPASQCGALCSPAPYGGKAGQCKLPDRKALSSQGPKLPSLSQTPSELMSLHQVRALSPGVWGGVGEGSVCRWKLVSERCDPVSVNMPARQGPPRQCTDGAAQWITQPDCALTPTRCWVALLQVIQSRCGPHTSVRKRQL